MACWVVLEEDPASCENRIQVHRDCLQSTLALLYKWAELFGRLCQSFGTLCLFSEQLTVTLAPPGALRIVRIASPDRG